MIHTPTYNKIRDLAAQLQQETKVRARREHGEKLHQLLSKDDIRRRLMAEATPKSARPDGFSVAASRCNAISKLWTLILTGAINAVKSIKTGKSKAKLNPDDVTLPYRLLLCCDSIDEVFEERPGIPKLPKKTVRSLVTYCLNMLSDALEGDEVAVAAEVNLLDMMNHLCSRVEYVSYFKPYSEFQNVLSELRERLIPDNEAGSYEIFYRAAKAFDSLFVSCKILGIQMDRFVSDALQLVSDWCKEHIQKGTVRASSNIIPHFFKVVTTILNEHPEQSIGPMHRNGRAFLSYCKRCYVAASGVNKDSLNSYLLAHLYVAQTAGRLQGLAGGDLGDLGKASLSQRQITELLELVVDDVDKVVVGAELLLSRNPNRRNLKGKTWLSLDSRQQIHLELAARLMARAQRNYLTEVEWNGLDNPNDLFDMTPNGEEGPMEARESSYSDLQAAKDSPWMMLVFRSICSKDHFDLSKRINTDIQPTMIDENTQPATQIWIPEQYAPLVEDMQSGPELTQQSPRTVLPILGACAEFFPAGECWTSSAFDHWDELPPDDNLLDDAIDFNGCAAEDIGMIVAALDSLLVAHGNPGGDPSIQSWILVCLVRLTESTSIVNLRSGTSQTALEGLATAWKSVWRTLFRSDLRYRSYSETADSGSFGELLFHLLGEIVHHNCTDLVLDFGNEISTGQVSFVHESQADFWKLPYFKVARSVLSPAPFEAICWILHVVGLSESGSDRIDWRDFQSFVEDTSDLTSSLGLSQQESRRKRLLGFTLSCLRKSVVGSTRTGDRNKVCDYDVSVILATILALINGKSAASAALILGDLYHGYNSDFHHSAKYRLSTLNVGRRTIGSDPEWVNMNKSLRVQSSCFKILWDDDNLLEFEKLNTSSAIWPAQDVPRNVATRLRAKICIMEASSLPYSDFVPRSESFPLRGTAIAFMKDRIAPSTGYGTLTSLSQEVEEDESSAPTDHGWSTVPVQSFMMKSLLCLFVFCLEDDMQMGCRDIVPEAMSFLSDYSSRLNHWSGYTGFRTFLSDLSRVTRTVLELASSIPFDLSLEGLDTMFGIYKDAMTKYASKVRNEATYSLSKNNDEKWGVQQKSKKEPISDFMDEDDDDFGDTARKTSAAQTLANRSSVHASGGMKKRKRGCSAYDDNDDDGDENVARKPRLSTGPEPRTSTVDISDFRCAQEIGSLLIAIDPSPATCEFVCESLLGAELDLEPSSLGGDIDLRVGSFCIRLWTLGYVLFYNSSMREASQNAGPQSPTGSLGHEKSATVLQCRVIELIRTCAPQWSSLYCAGGEECAALARQSAMEIDEVKMSDDDLKLLTQTLTCDDGTRNRPRFVESRIRNASRAFRVATADLHVLFDDPFLRLAQFTLESFSYQSRMLAYKAAGAALSKTAEDSKKYDSILQFVAPLCSSEKSSATIFRDWYEESGRLLWPGNEEVATEEVEDAFQYLETESIFCRAILAASSQNVPIFHQRLYEIVIVASQRPQLESIAFRALELVVSLRKYQSVDQMIQLEAEGLIRIWIENNAPELPLVLTAPSVLLKLRKNGKIGICCNGLDEESPETLDYAGLRQTASQAFIAKYQNVMVPLSLLHAARNKQALAKRGMDRERMLELFTADSHIQLIGFGEETESLLLRHTADTFGFCLPLSHSGITGYTDTAEGVINILNTIVSKDVVRDERKKKAHIVVRRIFEWAGKLTTFGDLLPSDLHAYFEAILGVLDSTKDMDGELFQNVGTNGTETLVRCGLSLDRSQLKGHQEMAWSSINLYCLFLIAQMERKDFSSLQLGFCVRFLTDAALSSRWHVRPLVLETLKKVLSAALDYLDDRTFAAELSPVMQRLIGACFHIHETCQGVILAECGQKHDYTGSVLRRSCGLRGIARGSRKSGGWGWDSIFEEHETAEWTMKSLAGHAVHIDRGLRQSLIGTYEVLELIFTGKKSSEIDPHVFVSAAPPYPIPEHEMKALESFETGFCGQKLAHNALDQLGRSWEDVEPDVASLVKTLGSTLEKSKSWTQPESKVVAGQLQGNNEGKMLGSLSAEQRLLVAEITLLGNTLQKRRAESDGPQFPNVRNYELQRLLRELSLACSASRPQSLRMAASRCLGQIDARTITGLTNDPNATQEHIWIRQGLEDEALVQRMQSRCLESLGECLKSTIPSTSLVAAETLWAVFGTQDGVESWHQISNPDSKRLLEPFVHKSRQLSEDDYTVSQLQITRMQQKAGLSNVETNEERLWCWSKPLWKIRESDSFEERVRILTTALILCCFKNRDSDARGKKGKALQTEFFWRCQKICSMDHNVCLAFFPCIILVLLGGGNHRVPPNVKGRMAECFATLLSMSDDDGVAPNTSATALLLDCLDLLCQVSLDQFHNLTDHKRNISSLPGRSPKDQKQKKSTNQSSQSKHNANLPELATWGGVPFGVMLDLDGLLVARACIRSNRFASAMYYIELYLNSICGKSGGIFEDLENRFDSNRANPVYVAKHGIGGHITDESDGLSKEDIKRSIDAAMGVVVQCLTQLHETEEAEAAKRHLSSFKFYEGEMDGCDHFDEGPVSGIGGKGQTGPDYMRIAETLEQMDTNDALEKFIEGVCEQGVASANIPVADMASLREKWFESSLRKGMWDLPKSDHDSSSAADDNAQEMLTSRVNQLPKTSTENGQGFFESLDGALGAIRNEDLGSCDSFLFRARYCVLENIAQAGTGESSLLGLVEIVDKLRAVGDLETVCMSGGRINDDVLRRWEEEIPEICKLDSSFRPAAMDLLSFSSLARELLLRLLLAKSSDEKQQAKILSMSVSQLWGSSAQARLTGQDAKAMGVMKRLKSLLRHPIDGVHSRLFRLDDMSLGIHLEESKILECRCDFQAAIRRSKQVADKLIHQEKIDGRINSFSSNLLADAQISCGKWMAKYKVQESNLILETYLRPGAERALEIFEADRTIRNADSAASASIELGQMVSNLYLALSSRFQSNEWKQSTRTVMRQEKELKRCEPLIKEAFQKFQKSKNNAKLHKQWQDLEIYCLTLKKDLARSKFEREQIETRVGKYLNLAIQSFANALSIADTGQDIDMSRHVYRMISLWFSNLKNAKVNRLISGAIERIPSFRFVPLTNQLFSRIERAPNDASGFQTTLQRLIFKMCSEHPYHTITPLLALKNGRRVGSGVSGRNVRDYLENVGDSKVGAASDVVGLLKRKAGKLVSGLLTSYAKVIDAYIHLADAKTESFHRTKTKNIPLSAVCSTAQEALDQCLGNRRSRVEYPPSIFTSPPPINRSADYGDGSDDPVGGERIAGFEKVFSITETGLHRPKIVRCLGTKGGKFRQLVKGEDEIRQDAIMTQVFGYVNDLMNRRNIRDQDLSRLGPARATTTTTTTTKAKFQRPDPGLKIITYHVIPLSPAIGVLEWVEDTMPFGDYILDKKLPRQSGYKVGAHSKYYPGEFGNSLCRIHLAQSPPKERRRTFEEICRRHSPVFRFFFCERFGHSTQAWHAARMKYTRSVAVNSIVGHILGIGDRHTSNILVHQKTGEVVHIDFGIVFEQGKLLNAPEKIPFRLTRNIVDGMGPCGTNGVFVSTAEQTIDLLRKNADALLTILSAVVADPLYKWNVSPVEARRRQNRSDDSLVSDQYDSRGDNGDGDDYDDNVHDGAESTTMNSASMGENQHNKAGAKEIGKIHEKLQGYEDSTAGEQQGVEGQVQLLINSARDHNNLCDMYPGWAPWV